MAEGVDLLVEALADPRDLALRDPQPQRLDDLIDLPRRDAGYVRLLDDRHQRLLRASARLEEAREVAAAAELRDRELELAGARVPAPRAVAVALRQPFLRGPLAAGGADLLGDLRLHQLLADPAQALAQEVEALLVVEQVADDLLGRHPLRLGHRGAPFVDPWLEPTSVSAAVAGLASGYRPTRSYTTLRDVTGW